MEIFKHIAKYDFIEIPPVQKLAQKDIEYIYEVLPKVDILIIQNISDNYKNNKKLSTKSIIFNTKKECKIIHIPNCYFDFYYPNLIYLDSYDVTLQEFYHDKNLLNLYFSNNSDYNTITKKYCDIMKNKDLYDEKYLLSKAYNSLREMKKRENEMKHDIKISDFIENNFKKKLLFYTINHPTKYLLNYICEKICEILNIQYVEQNLDPMETKCVPIHCSLSKIVLFDIYEKQPILNNISGLNDVSKYLLELYENNKFNFFKFFIKK
jgi:hypothetical protein